MIRTYIISVICLIPAMVFTGLWMLCEFLHFRVSGRLVRWFRKTDKKINKLFLASIGKNS